MSRSWNWTPCSSHSTDSQKEENRHPFWGGLFAKEHKSFGGSHQGLHSGCRGCSPVCLASRDDYILCPCGLPALSWFLGLQEIVSTSCRRGPCLLVARTSSLSYLASFHYHQAYKENPPPARFSKRILKPLIEVGKPLVTESCQ